MDNFEEEFDRRHNSRQLKYLQFKIYKDVYCCRESLPSKSAQKILFQLAVKILLFLLAMKTSFAGLWIFKIGFYWSRFLYFLFDMKLIVLKTLGTKTFMSCNVFCRLQDFSQLCSAQLHFLKFIVKIEIASLKFPADILF